jgi:deoxyinosine 3'endonuclease (endonuclease V)
MYFSNLIQYLAQVQSNLFKEVIVEDSFRKLERIAGVDVSFSRKNLAISAAVVIDLDTLEIMEEKTYKVELLLPYIPGFLGFRESDAMVSTLNELEIDFDVVMVNGHGILHPRRFGLASHVGLLADLPTIGVAKRLMVGTYKDQDANLVKFIRFMNQKVGACIEDKYVSIGHKISLETAIDLVLKTTIYKMPEPIRQAHMVATKVAKRDLYGN